MPASMSRLRRRLLPEARTPGGLGGWAPGDAAADDPVASVMAAAAASAFAASTVPAPDPLFWPPGRRKTVLSVTVLVTCAGLSAGNCLRMRATMPATTALAALVLLTWA